MTQRIEFNCMLTSPDTRRVALSLRGQLPQGAPNRIEIDCRNGEPVSDWSALLAVANQCLGCVWESSIYTANCDLPQLVATVDWNPSLVTLNLSELMSLQLLASVASSADCEALNAGWYFADFYDSDYTPLTLGMTLGGAGWCVGFKGAGHERYLVSRRWLEHGPWVLRRYPGDISIVQFHDTEVPWQEALEQTRVAQERLGWSSTGGFVVRDYTMETDPGIWRYNPVAQELYCVVSGRRVPEQEMLDACVFRMRQMLGPDSPILQVAYVFMEEDNARRHLHELWLREIEVRAINARGQEYRLTDGYDPAPMRPEWVTRVLAREGGAGNSSHAR